MPRRPPAPSHGTGRAAPALARWGLGLSSAVVALNLLYFTGLAFLVYAGYEAGEAFLAHMGFVFFSAGIVTLYFDVFWTLMDRSYFFMAGGLLLFLGGYLVERQRRWVLRRMGAVAGAGEAP